MDPFHFACPHCSSRLRVREKLYVGRHVDCPECGNALLIVERAGKLGVERIERKPGEPAPVPQHKRSDGQPPAATTARPGPAGEVAADKPADSSKPAGSEPAADETASAARQVVFRRRLFFVSVGAAAVIVAGVVALLFA